MAKSDFVCPLRDDRCPVFTKDDAADIKGLLKHIHDNQKELIERDRKNDLFVRYGLIIVAAIAAVAAISGVM